MNTFIYKLIFVFVIVTFVLLKLSDAEIIKKQLNYSIVANTAYKFDINNDGKKDFEFSYIHQRLGVCGPGFSLPKWAFSIASVTLVPYNYPIQVAYSSGNPSSSNSDDTIYSWSAPKNDTLLYVKSTCQDGNSVFMGNWISPNEKFLPYRILINGNWYYGWIRMKIQAGLFASIGLRIEDFAFNTEPNQSIFPEKDRTIGIDKIVENNKYSVFPNPFINSTTISFYLSKTENVALKIYDLNGKLIQTVTDEKMSMGDHQVNFRPETINAGIYILKIRTGNNTMTEKLVMKK